MWDGCERVLRCGWFRLGSDGCRVCEGVGGCGDVGGCVRRLSGHRGSCELLGSFGGGSGVVGVDRGGAVGVWARG